MEHIFYNGRIHTLDAQGTVAQAVGFEDGRITFVGTDAQAAARPAQARTDLEGHTVLPGFIDSHIHCVTYAWYENCVKLHGARSVGDMLALTEAYIDAKGPEAGAWIIGRGWNHHNFGEARMPTRQELDRAAPHWPVAYLRACGHVCAVNTAALDIICALEDSRELAHEIDRENGILYEHAARLFMKAMPPFDAGQLAGLITYAASQLNACGVTSIHCDDFRSLPVSSPYAALEAFQTLRDAGQLTVRACLLNTYDSRRQLDAYIADGYKTGQGDAMVRIGPVKIVTDGALGGGTAALQEPYANNPESRGTLHFEPEALTELIGHCRRNGLDVTLHAIGDRAMANAAQAVKASNEAFGDTSRRHGVLHCQVADGDTLLEMGRQGMAAFVQPVFVGSDMDVAEGLVRNPQSRKLYAWRSMLEAGMVVAGSACAPVEPINVLENIQYAVTREKLSGGPQGGWLPQERLSVRQAVGLFTTAGAWASYEEDLKGTLEPGKLADMVVLSEDIFEVQPHCIKDIRVLRTLVGGRTVFQR